MANGGIWFGLSDPRSQPRGESPAMTERFYCACGEREQERESVCVCVCVSERQSVCYFSLKCHIHLLSNQSNLLNQHKALRGREQGYAP